VLIRLRRQTPHPQSLIARDIYKLPGRDHTGHHCNRFCLPAAEFRTGASSVRQAKTAPTQPAIHRNPKISPQRFTTHWEFPVKPSGTIYRGVPTMFTWPIQSKDCLASRSLLAD
jgi:hypothetical protein